MDIAPIVSLLKDRIGLNPSSIGMGSIEQAILARMKHCGVGDAEEFLRRLECSTVELRQLIEDVVVCETSFFRDHAPFVALGKYVKDQWRPANEGKRLRILSIPCSTGEEPYSIAMLLFTAGLRADQFVIDAVDISERAIEIGRKGLYSDYSFRGKDLGFRKQFFEQTPDGYRIIGKVRKAVNFEVGNLLDGGFAKTRECYDVIFCRNLLIYFDDSTKDKAINTLSGILCENGVFFVGHAETARLAGKGFVRLDYPMSFGFVKRQTDLRDCGCSDRERFESDLKQLFGAVVAKRRPTPPPMPASSAAALVKAPAQVVVGSDVRQALEQAKTLADAGEVEQAVQIYEAILARDMANAEVYYRLGLATDAAGDPMHAEECLKKAVYLDPNHHDSLLYLKILAERAGDHDKAAAYGRRAERAIKRTQN